MERLKIVTWDLETGGFSPKTADIVEVGLVFSDGFTITEESGCLVRPQKPIPRAAINVHGITTERATKEGFPWKAVGPRMAKRLHEADMWCGFNLDFDIRFAEYCLGQLGIKLQKKPIIDVFKIAQRYIPSDALARKNLGKVANYVGVPLENAHRAVEDSSATLRVLEALINKIDMSLDQVLSDDKYLGSMNYGNDPFESFFNGLINGKKM